MNKNKVFWSEAEKSAIAERAADLRDNRPDLAGLPLLRAAMNVLPAHRRRKLIAMSQASWFEGAVAAEIRRRDLESKVEVELAPIFQSHAQHHLEWRAEHMAALCRHEKLLKSILKDLDLICRRLADEKEATGRSQA